MSGTQGVRIGVAGARGRMGRAVAAAVQARPGLVLATLFDHEGTEGETVDGRVLGSRNDIFGACDVVIDFSTPSASAELASIASVRGGPCLVIGSTGFDPASEKTVQEAARKLAIVKSGNFSLGVNVLLGLVARAARALPDSVYDVEISEEHHKRKVDAPSGTALMLGEAVAQGRGVKLQDAMAPARHGITGPRKVGSIGFSSLRLGDVIGEHSVLFAAEDEILTLSHSARGRSLFARGAVEAAAWVAGKPAGLYDMQDVLGMKG